MIRWTLPVLLFGTLARTPVAAALDPQRVPGAGFRCGAARRRPFPS